MIAQWFWRTALSGYFGGWNTGNMAEDQRSVEDFASGKNAEIVVAVPKPKADIWETRTFRLNNAHAKLLAIVLAHHQPLDLVSGQAIDVSKALAWINAKEFHHFFPRKFLEKKGERIQRINSLANFVMLTSASNKQISDSAPSAYLPSIAKTAGSKLAALLASNLIPEKAFEAALKDDFDTFSRLRSEHIHQAVLEKTGWKEGPDAGPKIASTPPEDDDDIAD
jgi:hypothetical protein